MQKQFSDKVAVVTGGSSGIGRASSIAFAKEGANVVVADIDAAGGKETVRLVEQAGGKAIFVNADVSKAVQVEALIKTTVEAFGRLDFAHNNAGIVVGEAATTSKYSEEDWDRVINTNLKGVWLCMKYEIPRMIKSGGGAIVNTSSIGGLVGLRRVPAYVASKHGIIGLTKAAALEYAKKGIRVNAICPGTVHTRLVGEEVPARLNDLHPMGRIARPDEIAASVIWLCSNASSFMTGHAMVIDGGRTAE